MSEGLVIAPGAPPTMARPAMAPSGWRAQTRQLVHTKRGVFSLVTLAVFLLLAAFGPTLAPYSPTAPSTAVLVGPSTRHLLGTTETGADVLAQVMVASRVSIVV